MKLCVTHTPLDLVFDGFNDPSVFTLTQSLCSFEVLKGHLHFLFFKRHHGILQQDSQLKTTTATPNQMLRCDLQVLKVEQKF